MKTVLTSQMIKEKAKQIGIDDIGIASIEAYKDAPVLMNPKSYFPEAKSVIVIAMRIPRGSYRGIEEGTHWHNYTYYSYNRLNTVIRPHLTYRIATFIEDFGWEACPFYPAVPERSAREQRVPGKLPNDIVMNIRLMAAGTAIGEMGHSKVFLNRKFGPRVRLGLILTDAVLEPDEMMEANSICNLCGRCVKECPGNAIPPVKEKRINVNINGNKVSWGDVQMGRCTLTHHGLNNKISPFLKKSFPHMAFDVDNTDMTEEEAYRMCYPLSNANWTTYDESATGRVIDYEGYLTQQYGYFALCGARGCIRACMDNLEKTRRIENLFKEPFYKKQSWLLDNKPIKVRKAVNQFRDDYLDKNYPGIRKGEYGYTEKAEDKDE